MSCLLVVTEQFECSMGWVKEVTSEYYRAQAVCWSTVVNEQLERMGWVEEVTSEEV